MPPRKLPRHVTLKSELSLTSATDAKDGEGAEGPPSFFLHANSGTPVSVAGYFDDVIVDLDGARFDKRVTPVIAGHETSGLGMRIGHTTGQAIVKAGETKQLGGKSISGPEVVAKGEVSSSSDVADAFIADAKAGFPFQVSIGADVDKAFYVEEGDPVEVNGKTYKGPLVVASKTRIRELSIAVLGADSNTSAVVAAAVSKQRQTEPELKEGFSMPPTFEEYADSIFAAFGEAGPPTSRQKEALRASYDQLHAKPNGNGGDEGGDQAEGDDAGGDDEGKVDAKRKQSLVAGYDPTEDRKKIAAEERRIAGLRATARKHNDDKLECTIEGVKMDNASLLAHAIESNWSVERHELECYRGSLPKAPAVHRAQQVREMPGEVISCAILRSGNQSIKVPMSRENEYGEKWGIEHWYDETILEASDAKELKNVTLHQVFDLVIEQAGDRFSGPRGSNAHIDATRNAMRKIEAAGYTTQQATNIFDDAANKLMLAGYAGVGTVWQLIAATRSVPDFKQSNQYRLTANGAYQQVGADGELEHGTLTDQKWTHQADTYGKIYQLTRKHLINDDLNAFSQLMAGLGREGARSLEELVMVEILNHVGIMWNAGNNNLATGDLTIEGLTEASQLFYDQTEDGAPIGIEPDRILVGSQDRVEAGKLYNQTEVRPGPGSADTYEQFTRNPFVNAFLPVVSPYLSNTGLTQRVHNRGDVVPNQDSDQWFMFPDPNLPQGASFVVSLLNGNATPILDSADVNFENLGMRWRAYHDFGVDPGDPILSVRSAGTA